MRIPQVYFECMEKRFKKQKKCNQTEDYSWIENINKPLIERISDFAKCKQLQDPKYILIISETIDKILEAGVELFQQQNQNPCIQLLGECNSIQLWNLCLQCCNFIRNCGNPKIIDMIFSYEHLINLIFHNPDYDLSKIYQIIQCLQFLIESMNTSQICKLKNEYFEKVFLRFMYINAFFQKSIYNLSNQEYQELFQLQLDNCILKFTFPSDDMINYQRYIEINNLRKILKHPLQSFEVQFNSSKNPYEQSIQIIKENKIDNDSILFDQVFIRLLCHYSGTELLIQKMFITNYIFHFRCLFQEFQFINNKSMLDITNRLIDQKDYLFLLIRMIAINKEESLNDVMVQSLQFIQSKQIQLFEQNTFLEKLWLFELQGIQDSLMEWKQEFQITEGNFYENKLQLSPKYQQIFFQQLLDQQFTQIFKKQSNYQQWNYIIISIIRKSFLEDGQTRLPYHIINPLLTYSVNLIIELPGNNQNQQLDYSLETQIIQGLFEILKNCCLTQQIQLQIRGFQLLNQLITYYKQEFDQVQIQNAQSEFMMPVPERYHKLLSEIWSNKILEQTLQNSQLNEQLYTYLITLLALNMGENPGRVREFYENNSLQYLIERIMELLQICSRGSHLIVTIINLLIAISTNEQAISLALSSNNQKNQENLIKQIFSKCYLPSIELLHNPNVSEDFAKKIIMLYSQSLLAKKQIEKVIENTFVQISQMVDLSKDKIEDIVSNQEKLQSFYGYSKSLQALLQLFMQLQPEKKQSSYRQFQGYEELQLEEAQRQKDLLFNSLLKNQKFVEALEKIIMSPILIGSKNKDKYIEHYVGILCKKNKINPFTSLQKELDLISKNYMIIKDKKIIDIGKLVDYDALSIHMSYKYFFRKIIKHISPQTYRGFYILSRFHLIHYLIKICISQGGVQLNEIHLLIAQLLQIYFLSSQHAGFHESIMMFMAAKCQIQKCENNYDEDIQIRRRISKENLIPLQESCLELINKLQQQATIEQKEFIINKYGEITQLFFVNFNEKYEQIKQSKGLILIQNVTYIQDILKSFKFFLNLFQNLIQQNQPISFTFICYQNKSFYLNFIDMIKYLDSVQKLQQNNNKEQEIIKKILPNFIEAFIIHIDNIIKSSIFRKILLDKIQLSNQYIIDPTQLEYIFNELIFSQTHLISQMIDLLLYNNSEGPLKNLFEQLIQKFQSIQDIQIKDLQKLGGQEQKEQIVAQNDLVQQLQGNEIKEQKKSIFDRPDIQLILDKICEMGINQKLAKKAIQRVEIPEPSMIVDMIFNGRISDDEEDLDDLIFESEQKSDNSQTLISNQKIQTDTKNQLEQDQNQKSMTIIDNDTFIKVLNENFPLNNTQIQVQDRVQQLINNFQQKLDDTINQLLDQQLNNQKPNLNLLEYLFTITKKQQHIQKILNYIFVSLQSIKQVEKIQDLNQKMSQLKNALQWLTLLQSICQLEHEKIYQNFVQIDQESQSDIKCILSFQEMIKLGFVLIQEINDQFIQQSQNEFKELKELNYQELNYSEIYQNVQQITNDLNVLYDNKYSTLRLFCRELMQVQKYLTRLIINQKNVNDQLIENYWNHIEIYIQFLIQICIVNFHLQEESYISYKLLEQIDTFINNNQVLKEQRDSTQNMIYLQYLIQSRFIFDKSIISQLLQCLNNFGLHNQNKLYHILIKRQFQNKQSLLDVLLSLKVHQDHIEYEESQPVFLENLIYLIGIDSQTAKDLVLLILKQVMLNEHIDWHAQQLKNLDQINQIQMPQQFIECQLQYLLWYNPVLINNPIVYNIIIEQQGLSIADQFSELKRIHGFKQSSQQTTSKLTKEQEKQFKEKEIELLQQTQTNLIIRYEIDHKIEPQLNSNLIDLINIIAQATVDRFFEENFRFIEQVFNIKLTQQKDDVRVYLYGWDQLLRIIEMLIIKIPQLILYLRQLKVSLPFEINNEDKQINFIQFIIQYLTWVSIDKISNFMHNYLSDINLLSFGYGVTLGQEVLEILLNELKIEQNNNNIIQKYNHILQLLVLFTQTLTTQNCLLILTDQRSQLNIVPKLINTLNNVRQCENKQFVKLYQQTIAKVLEPFLQSQVYLEHIKQGKYGNVFRLQQNITENSFQFHYLHCLKNQLICYHLYPNFKSTAGSAQHFISHPQVQQTLKDENQQEIIWPLYQSRKIFNNQKLNNQKQLDEDFSDSDSDLDILQIENSQIKYKANYSNNNSWGEYYSYDNDFISKTNINRDEERQHKENQNNIFPQKDLNILFCSLDQKYYNFPLPNLQITTQNITYHQNDYKSWITSVVGLYFSFNEYFENKKQLISKAYDNQLKYTVEYIQSINRLLISSTYYYNQQVEQLKQYLSYYLNGSLNYMQIQTGTPCFYSKFGQAPNQIQQDYQANSISININDPTFQQKKILAQISCNVLQSRVVLNGMPNDLYGLGYLKTKLKDLLHSEESLNLKPQLMEIPKITMIYPNEQQLQITDNIFLEMLLSLLLDQNNFLQFPFNLLRQISKCSRLGFKLLIQLLILYQEQKNNQELTLKILYLVSQKIPSNNLRDLLSEQLQMSPILNKREKANLAKGQQIKEQYIIEEENLDEQIQDDDLENPLVFLINQINFYSEKNVSFMTLFHNAESHIPIEKNILLTPLLANQTNLQLSYLFQIIRGSLMIKSDEKDNFNKFEDEKLYNIMRRQAVIYNGGKDERKIFELFSQLNTKEDIQFHDLIFQTFTDKNQESSDSWDQTSFSLKSLQYRQIEEQSQFRQIPNESIVQIQPPQPPQSSQPKQPILPFSVSSMSILHQQQKLQQFKQLRQQVQQIQAIHKLKIAEDQQQQQQQQEQEKQQQQQQQQYLQLQQQQQLLTQISQVNEDESNSSNTSPKRERKVSAKISHVEIDIISSLCKNLNNSLLREGNSNEIINILNSYANDTLKIEHAMNELTKQIIQQSKIFNFELDKKRKQLRDITNQREKIKDKDPEQLRILNIQENEIIKELNQKTPDPNIIQRCFIAITGFINLNIMVSEQQNKQPNKPSSTQTRQQIQMDKMKYKLTQQSKKDDTINDVGTFAKKEIRNKFINVLQTRQIHHLWLNVVETLLLIFNYKRSRSLELLQKKLYPLLECFLRLYQNVHEELNSQSLSEQTNSESNFFERNLSGSATNSLQFGLLQTQTIHLKRSFSSVRNENEMQMKIDELFTYLCINGKSIINYLINQRLQQISYDVKQIHSSNPIKLFREVDPLGFVFFKMSQIVSFENKKHFFEMDLETLKINEKPNSRSKGRQSETIEFIVVRETRLQQSLEKVLQVEKNKFRRSEIKIRYQGERGQDEGGIRKEWMTNLVKDILQTDKFELTTKRFYKINPNKNSSDDLNHYRLLGRIIAKSIYDGLLLPVYFIPTIFKLILQKKPSFDDLEHYNEGYYDTFIKFMNDETQVQYKDLFEFWIPEEYAQLIEQNKKYIFADILQEYLEKNPIQQDQQIKQQKQNDQQQSDVQSIDQEISQQQQQQQQQQYQNLEVPFKQDLIQYFKQKQQEQEQEKDEPKQKKQSDDITAKDMENREKKRLIRKNKRQQLSDEALKQIKLQDIFLQLSQNINVKHKRLICEVISKKLMIDEIKSQIHVMREGFFEILPKEYLQYMDWRDLQKLIIGVPSVDVDDLQANTEYVNYDKNNQTVIWFWEVLKTLSDSEKSDFLMFSTGSPLVPFGGFKNLRGPNGPKQFSISKDFNSDHFIKAHACFNRIDLPEYNSKEMVREKLLKSLKESGSGFDLS